MSGNILSFSNKSPLSKAIYKELSLVNQVKQDTQEKSLTIIAGLGVTDEELGELLYHLDVLYNADTGNNLNILSVSETQKV